MIRLKRAYDPPSRSDGLRILVDRLWPRGLSKQKARIDEWRGELAPSPALRKWYGHDPKKWPDFRRRYMGELRDKTEELQELAHRARAGTVTLVFATQNAERSNAVVLKSVLERLNG